MVTFIIGISGATNAGKTTLCERIVCAIPGVEVFHLDNYFWGWPEFKYKYNMVEELNHGNFEDLNSIDATAARKDILKWLEKASHRPESGPHILLVDGILLYNFEQLRPLFTKKYFLTMSKDECQKRRDTRVYEPPDPPGYFELAVWPEYLKYKDKLKDQKDIVYIDGDLPPDENFAQVIKDLQEMIKETHEMTS